ncbi:MAG: hypothetical protein ACTSPL_08060 [Candidatus Odinarchaeia archaeon]
MKIIVASFEALKHPCAIKIAKTIRKLGFNVELWHAPQIKIKNRLLRNLLRYLLSIVIITFRKADLYGLRT